MAFLDFVPSPRVVDVVGIWDQDFRQVFADSRPVKASVVEPSKNMEHPIETGSVITDHRVILPVEIDLSLIMKAATYAAQYGQIRAAFISGELFYVHTRTGVYKNMMITDIPHEESPEMFDTITMALKMREVQFVTAQFLPLPPRKVESKPNQSTKDRGQIQGKTPTTEQAGAVTARKSSLSEWLP